MTRSRKKPRIPARKRPRVPRWRPHGRLATMLLLGCGVAVLLIYLINNNPGTVEPATRISANLPKTVSPPPRPTTPPITDQQASLPSDQPPRPDASHLPAWRRNAVEVGAENGQPMIAIVIDDMGVDHARALEAIALPAPLTMSFMAYAKDLPALTKAARDRGHELMLHIPMQPLSAAVNPGPNALTTDLSDAEIRARLDWDLDRLNGIVGANNHMGSRFTEWPHGIEVVETALRDRGLFVLDSRTTPRTVVIDVAEHLGMPHAKRDVFLDDETDAPSVNEALAKTETIARKNGFAVAIGHPHDATMAALRHWLPLAAGEGFRLVPASAIVMHNEAMAGRVEDAAD